MRIFLQFYLLALTSIIQQNAQGFLTAGAFGHTFNEKSNNLILQYHQTIKESIDMQDFLQ